MSSLGNKPVMASNIKYYMAIKGINAKDLSKVLNVPYTTVRSWVNAEYYPRIDKIEMMSDYFGILKSDLIEEKQKQSTDDGLSMRKKAFMQKVQEMSDDQIARLEQILALVEKTNP